MSIEPTDGEAQTRQPPSTFGIIDLFALMTLTAVAVAAAAPFFQTLGKTAARDLIIIFVLQLLLFVGGLGRMLGLRKLVLDQAGPKLGTVYVGNLSWRHWPLVYSLLLMTGFAIAQLLVAFLIAKTTSTFGSLITCIQLALFGGYATARYLWRTFPCTAELCENGIISGGTFFYPWSDCKVRPSKFFKDRMVIVFRGNGLQDTKVVHIPRTLREKLDAVLRERSRPTS
jgi:hypothetical protein